MTDVTLSDSAARRIGATEHERSLTEIAAWLGTLGADAAVRG